MSNATNLPASAQSELIPIQNNDGAQAVLGRDLHAFLEIGKDYSTWFKDMCQYGFIAGQDFTPKSGKTSEAGGRPRIDHIISQYEVERGYLAVKVDMPRWRPNGESFVPAPTVRVTPKGLDRLAESLPTRRVGGADSEQ